jgi:hypothetical protein
MLKDRVHTQEDVRDFHNRSEKNFKCFMSFDNHPIYNITHGTVLLAISVSSVLDLVQLRDWSV